MAVDDSKLAYLSTWDIDQLYTTNTVTVGSGTSVVYTIPTNIPPLPEYEVQFQPTGDTKWYQAGSYSPTGALAAKTYFVAFVSGTTISVTTTAAGTIRYFIWTDKFSY